jgi:hypothetical protein
VIVALSGYARAGKDTFGQVLQVEQGFIRVSFAAALKGLAVRLDPILEVEADLDTAPYKARLSDIIDLYGGLEQAKELPAVREYLQRLGSEARETFGKDAWVKAARLDEALAEHGDIVVTDCRFKNEAQAVKDLGGIVVRIERFGVGPVNGHASEHDLDDWPFDASVSNDSSITALNYAARDLVSRFRSDRARALQAAGPDEYPTGYYEHLAREGF